MTEEFRSVPVAGPTYDRLQHSFNSGYDTGHAAGVAEGRRQAREAVEAVAFSSSSHRIVDAILAELRNLEARD